MIFVYFAVKYQKSNQFRRNLNNLARTSVQGNKNHSWLKIPIALKFPVSRFLFTIYAYRLSYY